MRVDAVYCARVPPWLGSAGGKEVQQDKPRSVKAKDLFRQLLELLTLVPAHALIYETGDPNNRFPGIGEYQDTAPSWTLSFFL